MASQGCARCGEKKAFGSPFCPTCKSHLSVIKPQVLTRARQVLATSGPLSGDWDRLTSDVAASGFAFSLFLSDLQRDARNWLGQYRAFALADGAVTEGEVRGLHEAARRLQVSEQIFRPVADSLERAFHLTEVRAGRLARVYASDVHLPNDEHCYFVGDGVRYRQLRSGTVPHQGRVIMTSKNFTFAAPSQGGQIPWGKINRVVPGPQGTVQLEASVSRLAGPIWVADAEWLIEVAMTLIRMDRRQVLDPRRGRTSIPQHVRAEVWRRDGGRCQECGLDGSGGASLEFDHVIPVALGGADTAKNLQVLCRSCNLRKAARI